MTRSLRKVGCIENYKIVDFLYAERDKFNSDYKSYLYKNVDNANVGPWILKLLKVYFDGKNEQSADAMPSSQDAPPSSQEATGRKVKTQRKYCPRKNSASYALLITLLRAHKSGREFLKKQEFIDEAEKSGLSEKPIMPNPTSWNGGQSNHKDWYCGWSSMKTLKEKGLVIKTSNPAKFRLTEEGKSTAEECIYKAGLTEDDPVVDVPRGRTRSGSGMGLESPSSGNLREIPRLYSNPKSKGHLSADGGDNSSQRLAAGYLRPRPPPIIRTDTVANLDGRCSIPPNRTPGSFTSEASLTTVEDALAVPPLRLGERFGDVYDVVCILDNRERFRQRAGTMTTCLVQFTEKLSTNYKVTVDIRQLPVGDALWIARHKQLPEEYVLDFAVERKQVDDLWSSIKDNRYKQQKLRLLNCGLKRLFYLVEGDVNAVESTEALKTAMFTTELQGGFRVLRSTDNADTNRQYGQLTHAIISRYNMEEGKSHSGVRVCKTYNEFLEHCKEFEKDRVTDVFCRMLTQIPQVTEDVALSIVEKYRTVISLIRDYEKMENYQEAQKMLQGIPIRHTTKTVSAVISKKVYQAFWAPPEEHS